MSPGRSALRSARSRRRPGAAARRCARRTTPGGQPSVIGLSIEDYEHLRTAARAARPRFVEHLLTIPPVAEEAEEIPRATVRPRPVEL